MPLILYTWSTRMTHTRNLALCCAAATLFACNKQSQPDPTPTQPSPRQAEIAASVTAALDATTAPCDDFYQYACGGWAASTELPGDKARWVRSFDAIYARNQEQLRTLLESQDPEVTSRAPRAIAFYQACMNTEAADARGVEPITSRLTELDSITTNADLFTHSAKLQKMRISPFARFSVYTDAKNPDINIAHVRQGGLGLPDRSFFLDEARAETLAEYQKHITATFELIGATKEDADALAAHVIAFETSLARGSKPRAELRDPDKTYNKMDLAALQARAPQVPWDAYFKALGLDAPDSVNVNNPEFLDTLNTLLTDAPTEQVRAYVKWNLLRSTSTWATTALDAEHFRFYGQVLNNKKEQAPRWKQCVDTTNWLLGFELGQLYVSEHFAGASRDIAQGMVDEIQTAFAERLPELSWMDEKTREAAAGKLQTVYDKIGYPKNWRDYSSVEITPDRYFEAQLATRAFEFDRRLAQYKQPVDRSEWYMTPPTVNAYYSPTSNQIVFPAGILQPPFFDAEFPAAMNFGGIGMVIGHEITHGFDDGGRKFDATGKLTPWWQPEAIAQFEERAQCVDDYYSAIEVQPGKFINGKLTLGENIADIGGLKLAYYGYQRHKKDKDLSSPVAGLSDDQLFFVAFAQTWCSLSTPENEQMRLLNDSHSPPRWRVNATLSNLPEFHQAFSCGEETPMRPKNQCDVW